MLSLSDGPLFCGAGAERARATAPKRELKGCKQKEWERKRFSEKDNKTVERKSTTAKNIAKQTTKKKKKKRKKKEIYVLTLLGLSQDVRFKSVRFDGSLNSLQGRGTMEGNAKEVLVTSRLGPQTRLGV